MTQQDKGRICVVIDLDETLVHSSFKVNHKRCFVLSAVVGGGPKRKGQRHQLQKEHRSPGCVCVWMEWSEVEESEDLDSME